MRERERERERDHILSPNFILKWAKFENRDWN